MPYFRIYSTYSLTAQGWATWSSLAASPAVSSRWDHLHFSYIFFDRQVKALKEKIYILSFCLKYKCDLIVRLGFPDPHPPYPFQVTEIRENTRGVGCIFIKLKSPVPELGA